MEIPVELLIEELKAQRNALADQMAVAGATIMQLREQLKEKESKEQP